MGIVRLSCVKEMKENLFQARRTEKDLALDQRITKRKKRNVEQLEIITIII
jgi:hypothetical protein